MFSPLLEGSHSSLISWRVIVGRVHNASPVSLSVSFIHLWHISSTVIGVSPFSCLESIYGHEFEYISFLAQEYEYIYPLGEVNMGPNIQWCSLPIYHMLSTVLFWSPFQPINWAYSLIPSDLHILHIQGIIVPSDKLFSGQYLCVRGKWTHLTICQQSGLVCWGLISPLFSWPLCNLEWCIASETKMGEIGWFRVVLGQSCECTY